MNYIFLSHDVDWPKEGAPKEHIEKIRDRFTEEDLKLDNPFDNFNQYMELEEKFDVRSTWFFRTSYDLDDYRNDIKNLEGGGWEIGLHTEPETIDDIDLIKSQKEYLETFTRNKIVGNRVHYLKFNIDLLFRLNELGFLYDSTVKNSKKDIQTNDMGFYHNQIIEFPITIMDAYLFTYSKLKEDQLISHISNVLNTLKSKPDKNIITLIWHDNVLRMKGGRMYGKILEFLTQQDDFEILTGKELVKKC